MATSSRDLKSVQKRKSKSVVARLAKAAKEAAAKEALKKKLIAKNPALARKESSKLTDSKSGNDEEDDEENHLSSILSLASAIDEELLQPRDGYRPPRETSSMRSLLDHNDQVEEVTGKSKTDQKKVDECIHVAMVFSKPLMDAQITVEFASRLVSLAKAIKYEEYQPSLICFCGSTASSLVAEPSAGIIYFRHLCASNDISLEDTELCVIDHNFGLSLGDHWSKDSLGSLVEELYERDYLRRWLERSTTFESGTDEYGFRRQQPRKKIHLHWTLVSTDYDLCNLNDIHERSPRQSPLNTILQELEQTVRGYRGIVKATWCFRYTTYPFLYSQNDLTSFLGKCFLLAQKLRPLLVNMRGVNTQEEFFQRDNYRALVATRRSLVELLEQMNEAFRENRQRTTESGGLVTPNLKGQLRKSIVNNPGIGNRKEGLMSIDVALESAVLSLGRCMDLVRPAGILSSKSVSREEWANALQQLEHFLELMQRGCDPDSPLAPEDWGKLSVENVTETSAIVQIVEDPEMMFAEPPEGLDPLEADFT